MAAVAVGDALGDIGRSAEHRSLYGIVTDMYDGAKSTDDTEFAVLTARALLDSGGVLTYASVEQAWRRYIIDAGGMFARGGRPLYGAVKNLERGMSPPLSGRDNVFNTDDGAAMRIAPIGILFAGDPERAAAAAEIDARVSHDTSGVWSAQAVAAGVAVSMVDATADELAATMLSYIPDDSWLGRSMAKAVALCDAASSVEDVWAELHTEFHTPEHAAVEEAVPQSFAISVLTGLDFRTGMFWAANFGRDADTISAIVGAIAGARHGIGAIPHHWVEKVRKPAGTCLRFAAQEDVVNLGEELAELATKLGVGEPV
jgi:ADP-ribosylglycohydrolase